MRVLAFDPGGEKMGWAVVEEGPAYINSGIEEWRRGEAEKYQSYRLRLIQFWSYMGGALLDAYKPNLVVSEIVPAVSGGTMASGAQRALAATAITAVQTIAYERGYAVSQIGATTVKVKIAGKKTATKPKVRDGVYTLLPQVKDRHREWSGKGAKFDEPDALAVALVSLGYTNSRKEVSAA